MIAIERDFCIKQREETTAFLKDGCIREYEEQINWSLSIEVVEGGVGDLENSHLDLGFILKTSEALPDLGVWGDILTIMVKCCPEFSSLSP